MLFNTVSFNLESEIEKKKSNHPASLFVGLFIHLYGFTSTLFCVVFLSSFFFSFLVKRSSLCYFPLEQYGFRMLFSVFIAAGGIILVFYGFVFGSHVFSLRLDQVFSHRSTVLKQFFVPFQCFYYFLLKLEWIFRPQFFSI